MVLITAAADGGGFDGYPRKIGNTTAVDDEQFGDDLLRILGDGRYRRGKVLVVWVIFSGELLGYLEPGWLLDKDPRIIEQELGRIRG